MKQLTKRLKSILNIFNNRVFYTLLSGLVIFAGSYLAIQYARGNYRLTKQGFLLQSGLLSANSFPPGAQVIIDDKLITATDDTIYLEPGEYDVEIVKDGYSPWRKKISIKEELVTQTNAQLFPAAPSITPLTFTGAQNLLPSPDGRKIVYYTASASAKTKNGLYLLELSDTLNPFQKTSKQIAEDEVSLDLAQAQFIWSPDSTQLMVLSPGKQVLIDVSQKTNLAIEPDISFKRKQILSQWEEEIYIRERQYLKEFPEEMVQIATQSAKNIYISPDKKKLLYTATENILLPENIVPPIPSTNYQPEDRSLVAGKIYVYDMEEDKNFLLASEAGTELTPTQHNRDQQAEKGLLANDLYNSQPLSLEASPSAFQQLQATSSAQTAFNFNSYYSSLFINTLQWFSDSTHLIFTKDGRIQVVEYDGGNNTTLYSGPFAENFIYPWPDGSRLVILTSFSQDSPNNLYTIELK